MSKEFNVSAIRELRRNKRTASVKKRKRAYEEVSRSGENMIPLLPMPRQQGTNAI